MGWSQDDLTRAGALTLRDLYLTEAVLDLERSRLFASSWSLVASVQQLAAPGDYVAATVAGAPVLVLRRSDGELAAYHNVCRHRGITLAEGEGRLGRHITCPYHQWSYGLDGTLVNIPQQREQFAGVAKDCLALWAVQVAQWHGMVFARISGQGPDLVASLGELGQRLEGFCSGPLVEVARVSYEAACNWKLLVENHVDVYHLWYLHARSLSGYAHSQFRWDNLEDNWWSLEPLKDQGQAPVGGDALDWVSEAERTGIGAYLFFPNLMIVTTGRYFATYDATPLAPGRTQLTLRVRARQGTDAGPLVDDIRSFMAEDIEACRRLQEALSSPAFAVGPLAQGHEQPVRAFHASLRQRLCWAT